MDNLTAHTGERVRELIEHRGCELLYLPPCPPNFDPVEKAFLRSKRSYEVSKLVLAGHYYRWRLSDERSTRSVPEARRLPQPPWLPSIHPMNMEHADNVFGFGLPARVVRSG